MLQLPRRNLARDCLLWSPDCAKFCPVRYKMGGCRIERPLIFKIFSKLRVAFARHGHKNKLVQIKFSLIRQRLWVYCRRSNVVLIGRAGVSSNITNFVEISVCSIFGVYVCSGTCAFFLSFGLGLLDMGHWSYANKWMNEKMLACFSPYVATESTDPNDISRRSIRPY